MKYFLYARKSSESEDKQVQSIDDQIKFLKQRYPHITIQAVLRESKSAKAPYQRPVFDKMLQDIEIGKADGIMCWQINRLSRNPVDSGKLSWMLQKSILKSILTFEKEYRPEDNVLVFNVETGMANQYILDLSKNVKRGVKSKIEKGWFPAVAPQGYLNDKAEHTIIKDPERFDIVKRMWKFMLTGNYNARQIVDMANQEWGFTTVKRKRIGGIRLSRGGMYSIFNNLFYTGYFEWNGERFKGNHEPMITLEEYDRVQLLLGKKGKSRQQKHNFAYTSLITCGHCGCRITCEERIKYNKASGETKKYRYYHCTNKKEDFNCPQRLSIPEDQLEEQIETEIQKYTIIPEFKDWALEVLQANNKDEIQERVATKLSIDRQLEANQKKLDKLSSLLLEEAIEMEEYRTLKVNLKSEKVKLEEERNRIVDRADQWMELTEKTFEFVTYAEYHFRNTESVQCKKEIFSALGQNFILKDKKLSIEANEWLIPISEFNKKLQAQLAGSKPDKTLVESMKKEQNGSLCQNWLGTVNQVREIIARSKECFYVPSFDDRF